MFTLCLIKLNLFSSSELDMKRCYLTVFAIESQLLFEKLKGNWSLKRKKQSVKVIRENSCMLKEAVTTRSSRLQMLFKIGVLVFTGKHPCWSLF